MKFKNVNYLSETQKIKIKRLLGVRHKMPIVMAKLQEGNTWNIFVSHNDGPINADTKLNHIDTFYAIEEVIEYFNKMDLVPYCLESEIDQETSGNTEKEHRNSAKDILHRRNQYRKNVTLEGHVLNPNTMEIDVIIIKDLSFNGVGFFTSDYMPVEIGSILEIEFTLNNKKQSVIKRRVEVKHASGKQIGGEFVNKPRLDANLGFYLMFNIQ